MCQPVRRHLHHSVHLWFSVDNSHVFVSWACRVAWSRRVRVYPKPRRLTVANDYSNFSDLVPFPCLRPFFKAFGFPAAILWCAHPWFQRGPRPYWRILLRRLFLLGHSLSWSNLWPSWRLPEMSSCTYLNAASLLQRPSNCIVSCHSQQGQAFVWGSTIHRTAQHEHNLQIWPSRQALDRHHNNCLRGDCSVRHGQHQQIQGWRSPTLWLREHLRRWHIMNRHGRTLGPATMQPMIFVLLASSLVSLSGQSYFEKY